MENIVLLSISKNELESLIENSVRKILNENVNGQNSNDDGLLTVKETANFLRLAVPTIYGYIHLRKIPCFKKGKRLYFSKDALINWVKEGKLKTLSEIEQEANTYLLTRKYKRR